MRGPLVRRNACLASSKNQTKTERAVLALFSVLRGIPMRASLVRPLPTGLQLGSRTPGVAALAESDEDRTLRYTLRLEPGLLYGYGDAYATRGSFVLLPCVRPAPLTPDRPPPPPPSMACGVAWRNGVTSAYTCELAGTLF